MLRIAAVARCRLPRPASYLIERVYGGANRVLSGIDAAFRASSRLLYSVIVRTFSTGSQEIASETGFVSVKLAETPMRNARPPSRFTWAFWSQIPLPESLAM